MVYAANEGKGRGKHNAIGGGNTVNIRTADGRVYQYAHQRADRQGRRQDHGGPGHRPRRPQRGCDRQRTSTSGLLVDNSWVERARPQGGGPGRPGPAPAGPAAAPAGRRPARQERQHPARHGQPRVDGVPDAQAVGRARHASRTARSSLPGSGRSRATSSGATTRSTSTSGRARPATPAPATATWACSPRSRTASRPTPAT